MLGMALGVCALIVVLSVMNGFQKEIRTRILGIAPHLQINAESNDLVDWQPTLQVIKSHPQVVAAAPFINGQGMISFDQNVQGVMVRGILPQDEKRVIDISNKMKSGSLNDLQADGFGIALGSDLARSLGAHVGDKVLLISPQGQVTPAGMMPRLKQFHVAAIFEIGMAPYDNALALIHLSDAQRLYRMDGTVSGISARLHDLDLAPQVSAEIGRSLPRNTYVSDWTRQHANYFRAVQIEKKMMFIILSLIVAVAAFNIVSTMVMAVTDKRADIAILRTLGATPASIMRIFIVQGVIIGLVGSVLGVAGGILLTLNIDTVVPFIEKLVGMHFLSKEVYFITELPSDLQCNDVLIVAGFSFLISLLATIYPSWRASKVQPAEALRYE
jgi:lipoprotein-releasing system permease protein